MTWTWVAGNIYDLMMSMVLLTMFVVVLATLLDITRR